MPMLYLVFFLLFSAKFNIGIGISIEDGLNLASQKAFPFFSDIFIFLFIYAIYDALIVVKEYIFGESMLCGRK